MDGTSDTMDAPLRIRIPKRVWPPAPPPERDRVTSQVERYVKSLVTEPDDEMRTYYGWRLFRCIHKQPILIAINRPFRDAICKRVIDMEKEVLKSWRNEYTDDFLDAAHELLAVLCEIHEHPEYKE